MTAASWESAFVAVSVALEGSVEQASACLDAAAAARAADVIRGLRSPSRTTRAGVLASALAPVAMEIERMELR